LPYIFYDEWKITKEAKENLSLILEEQFKEQTEIKGEHPKTELKDINKAFKRIEKAIATKEKIIVFGDYDVDGTVGSSILTEALEKCGATVSYRLPHRKKDGYGLKKHILDEIKASGASLVITVDNGISAIEESAYAKELGIDLIITDHHIVPEEKVSAHAVINPQQNDCPYPFKEICGAAVAYKLACFLCENLLSKDELKNFQEKMLCRVALATVCDCMPIIDENKHFVRKGLQLLKEKKDPQLISLINFAGLDIKEINEESFGFQLGPRINAAGRLSSAYFALQFLLGKDQNKEVLESLNQKRKDIVKESIQDLTISKEKSCIIIHSKEFHIGVIGLIAGRLTEKYNLPSIVLSEETEKLTASCRAPVGFNLYSFLKKLERYFTHFGGHESAAGFSMAKKDFPAFKKEATSLSKEILKNTELTKELKILSEIKSSDINLKTLEEINNYAPFGIKNEKPIFLVKDYKSIEWKIFGKKEEHLAAFIKSETGNIIKAIKFFAAEKLPKITEKTALELAVSLKKNVWQNTEKVELELIDVKIT
jgi:single-stranded-DNA-specific exonuclease